MIVWFVLAAAAAVAVAEIAPAVVVDPTPNRVCEVEEATSLTAHCSKGFDRHDLKLNHCAFGAANAGGAADRESMFGCSLNPSRCESSVSYGVTDLPHYEFLRPDLGPYKLKKQSKIDALGVPFEVPFPLLTGERMWDLPALETTSSIRCLIAHGRQPHTSQVCWARNIAIDFRAAVQRGSVLTVQGMSEAVGSVTAYCKQNGFIQPDQSYSAQEHGASWNGLFQHLKCIPHPEWKRFNKTATPDSDSSSEVLGGKCDITVPADQAVITFMRDEWRSYFHSLGDLIRMFLVLHKYNAISTATSTAATDADAIRSHLQLLVFDSFPPGAFWPLWETFSSKAEAMRPLPNSGEDYDSPPNTRRQILNPDWYGKRVCFGSLLLSFPCRAMSGGWDRANIYSAHPCLNSTLFVDFKRFVVNHFAATAPGQITEASVDPPIRSDHRSWPEIGALPALSDVLPPGGEPIITPAAVGTEPIQLVLIHRPKSYSGRQILNEPALVSALRTRYPPHLLNVRVIDFGKLSFSEQLRIIRNTHILVGVHGAGLTHITFLRSGSVAIELCNQKTYLQSSYQNLATHNTVHYLRWINTHSENHHTPPPGAVSYDNDEITANVTVDISDWCALIREALKRLLSLTPPAPKRS